MRHYFSLITITFAVFSTQASNAENLTFTGTWQTTYGVMNLTQTDGKVSGTYRYRTTTGTLQGTVKENKFTFTYQEPTASGEGSFTLSADGKSFSGQWRPEGTPQWLSWKGVRVSLEVTKPGFAGLWQTSFGRMRLVEDNGNVHGIYGSSGAAVIRGKVKGNRYTFTYQEPNATGEGWFELSPNGQVFQGQWREQGSEQWASWNARRIRPQPGKVWLVVLETRWENSLADQEYSFGEMLRTFFARSPHVQVRHRFFSTEAGYRKWAQELAYLAEPIVLSLASHGTEKGLSVHGKTITPEAIAESLQLVDQLKLVHFSSCQILRSNGGEIIQQSFPSERQFPISGYTTSVDWAASAVIEFLYFDFILSRRMTPAQAAEQLKKSMPIAGDKPVPGSALRPAGFRLLLPKGVSQAKPALNRSAAN